jgi:branched-subunit amino acid aminotransferase/4-amino-4-deoxychorismate lyase
VNITVDELKKADAIFVSLSSFGIVEVSSLDRSAIKASPLVKKVQQRYQLIIAT